MRKVINSAVCGCAFLFIFVASVYSQSGMGFVPVPWQTVAESTDYKKTSTYDETIAYCKKLATASRGMVKYQIFGTSGEGREIPLLIASSEGVVTPTWAKRTGKPIILIQAGIHAGEIDGKDAGLALLRDIVITKARRDLLQNAIILFIPIYNVDGHE